MDALPGFLLAAVALAGSPGPATLGLTATGAAFGARRGLLYLAGIVLGMALVMAIVASGVVGLMLAIPGVTPVIGGLAALYFLHLAWRIATAPPLSEASAAGRAPGLAAGLLLSLVNPKGYAAMAALYSGFVLDRHHVLLDVAFKTALLVVVMIAVNLAWLLAGASLSRAFRDPRRGRRLNLAFAGLLLASVAVALWP